MADIKLFCHKLLLVKQNLLYPPINYQLQCIISIENIPNKFIIIMEYFNLILMHKDKRVENLVKSVLSFYNSYAVLKIFKCHNTNISDQNAYKSKLIYLNVNESIKKFYWSIFVNYLF